MISKIQKSIVLVLHINARNVINAPKKTTFKKVKYLFKRVLINDIEVIDCIQLKCITLVVIITSNGKSIA